MAAISYDQLLMASGRCASADAHCRPEPRDAGVARVVLLMQAPYMLTMLKFSAAVLVMIPTAALAADQTLPSGQWGITSTTVEMSVPGLPGFAARMMRGKSKTERKRLSEGQGVSELIAPDPKAGCRIDGQQVTDGRYEQTLSCPQKRGEPI